MDNQILIKLFFSVAGGLRSADSIWEQGWVTAPTKDAENFTAFGVADANW